MWPREVVIEEVEADSVGVELDLLTEPIGEPREPAHPHPHGEVLTLHVARRDAVGVRVARDDPNVDPGTDSGAVGPLGVLAGVLPVDFVQHREVDLVGPQTVHDAHVVTEAVRGQLDASVPQAHPEVAQERVAVLHRPLAHEPRRDQLRVGVDGGPRPHVAVAEHVGLVGGDVLLLGVAERPNLVALDYRAGQVDERLGLVLRGRLADVLQQVRDGLTGDSGGSADRPHGHSLAEQADDLTAPLCAQPVHTGHYAWGL